MAILYVDANGEERNRHSYSAGLEFSNNPYRYYLHRIMGWKEKDTKAALLFGRDLEDTIEFYHKTGGKADMVEEFTRLWAMHKDNKQLVYTTREISWDSLLRAGTEMMRLYKIRLPSLPIPMDTIFQRALTKEVFPGNAKYGGIEFYAKLDMITRVQPDHPMLPKVAWTKEQGLFRSVVIDIKTSGLDLDDTKGIVAHDLQLRQYAWISGIFDVAFLQFKKCGHSAKKGYSVTLLENVGRFAAGDEAVIASVEDEGYYLVGNDVMIEEMNKAQGYRPGTTDLDTKKEAKERAAKWRDENAVFTKKEDVTRQRLQFSAATVEVESAKDAGLIAADQIVRIVNAWETNKWTNTFGIRFPHDDRRDNYFKAFCLRDNVLRDSIFEQKTEEDLKDDYFDEPEEAL
jgi:hypothetical protein